MCLTYLAVLYPEVAAPKGNFGTGDLASDRLVGKVFPHGSKLANRSKRQEIYFPFVIVAWSPKKCGCCALVFA